MVCPYGVMGVMAMVVFTWAGAFVLSVAMGMTLYLHDQLLKFGFSLVLAVIYIFSG